MKIIKLEEPVYHRKVFFVLNCSGKEFNDWVFKKYGYDRKKENWNNTGTVVTIENEREDYIHALVWVSKVSKTKSHILVHEAFHLACKILDDRGVDFCLDSEEAFAYLQEYYYKAVMERL